MFGSYVSKLYSATAKDTGLTSFAWCNAVHGGILLNGNIT